MATREIRVTPDGATFYVDGVQVAALVEVSVMGEPSVLGWMRGADRTPSRGVGWA